MDVMLDLETMSTDTNAAILSMGAVRFKPYEVAPEDQPFDSFYINVDLQSCMDVGLAVSGSTIAWWMRQSEAARNRLFVNAVPLTQALNMFSAWYNTSESVWGNGANFDNVVMRNAYNAVKLPCPFKFYEDRCYRTLKNMVDFTPRWPDVPHDALSDAIAQARHLQRCMVYLTTSMRAMEQKHAAKQVHTPRAEANT